MKETLEKLRLKSEEEIKFGEALFEQGDNANGHFREGIGRGILYALHQLEKQEQCFCLDGRIRAVLHNTDSGKKRVESIWFNTKVEAEKAGEEGLKLYGGTHFTIETKASLHREKVALRQESDRLKELKKFQDEHISDLVDEKEIYKKALMEIGSNKFMSEESRVANEALIKVDLHFKER